MIDFTNTSETFAVILYGTAWGMVIALTVQILGYIERH